jgi:DNA-binding winged helix-turn-helix (wHTH) protein
MRIGAVEFDPATGEVGRGKVRGRLEPQPAAVLALLASKPGQLIAQNEIRRAIWGDTTHVNFQQNLHYCIKEIRAALGDHSRGSKFVETIPRRGYRLIAPVDSAGPVELLAQPDRHVKARALWAALVIVLIVGSALIEQRPNRHHEITISFLRAIHQLVF